MRRWGGRLTYRLTFCLLYNRVATAMRQLSNLKVWLGMQGQSKGNKHTRTHTPACITCKRLRKTAQECCSLGHHEAGHVPRRPQLQLCEAHRLPPCPICARTQRGVRHCCARGHHKVCTPVQPSRKRCSSQQPKRSYKRPRVGPSQTSQASLRSPHQPPTPPAPKRRRPKTPSPPSPPTPVPQGLVETPDTEAICRQLFLGAHGRASSEVT